MNRLHIRFKQVSNAARMLKPITTQEGLNHVQNASNQSCAITAKASTRQYRER